MDVRRLPQGDLPIVHIEDRGVGGCRDRHRPEHASLLTMSCWCVRTSLAPALFQPDPLPGLGAPSLRRRRPEGIDRTTAQGDLTRPHKGVVLVKYEVVQCGASAPSPMHQGMPVNPQMYVQRPEDGEITLGHHGVQLSHQTGKASGHRRDSGDRLTEPARARCEASWRGGRRSRSPSRTPVSPRLIADRGSGDESSL